MTGISMLTTLHIDRATGNEIRAGSSGEVVKPETIDFRSFEPVPDGLFDERLFGPLKGWRCDCGAARDAPLSIVTEPHSTEITCPACGLPSPRAELYCDGMGHLELAAPVHHPWFGDEAAAPFLLEALPVLPPDLRPMKRIDSRRLATSHLNDLYRRVINRSHRLKRIVELQAPDKVIRHERQMLQHAVEALLDNGRLSDPLRDNQGRVMMSLSDLLAAEVRALNEGDRRSAAAGRLRISTAPALAGSRRFREIIRGDTLSAPGTPKSAWSLIHRLRALGLKVTLGDGAGREIALNELPQALGSPTDQPSGAG